MPIAPSEKPAGAPGAPYTPAVNGTVVVVTDHAGVDKFDYTDGDDDFVFASPVNFLQGLSAQSHRITALGTPVSNNDAVTKLYVDNGFPPSLSPVTVTTSGALSTQQFVSGAAAQVSIVSDVEVHTPVTFNPGVATTATCKVDLSPDNTTFSTLVTWTEPVGVALDGTIHDVTCRVPAGWFLKLTVNAQAVLGLSTYY